MKKIYHKKRVMSFMAGLALATPAWLNAQINLTATAGNPGPTTYTSLNAAFAAVNAGTHAGAITIQVVGNTTEPATPTPLLKSGGTSNYTSILITPYAGNFTISANSGAVTGRGIIELTGADNVTIDGDDALTPGAQNLTIISGTTTTSHIACIRLASNSTTGTDGADNNTIKNCIIKGPRDGVNSSVPSFGIQFTDGVNATTNITTAAYSSINTTIENNIIHRCAYGIYAGGNNVNYLNTGLKIKGNTIGSVNASEYVSLRGIFISHSGVATGATNAVISDNDIMIGWGNAANTVPLSAIEVAAANTGLLITRNNIHDCKNATISNSGMYGIGINSATSNTAITITNNFIRDMTSTYSTWTTVGNGSSGWSIFVNAAATDLIINNNTFAQGMSTTASSSGGCISILAFGASIAQMMNNIFVNNSSYANTRTIVFGNTGHYLGATISNNNYYHVGLFSTVATATDPDLTAWKTTSGKDLNSLNEYPNFVSNTDLHIQNTALSTGLESGGAPVATTGVGIDIDSQSRPGPVGSVNGGGTAPDIGADEFDGKKITCPALISNSIIVSSTTHTSAVVTWANGGTEQIWIVRYTAPTTTVLAVAKPQNLINLTPSTVYSVQIRALCAIGDTSAYSVAKPFRTLCAPPSILSASVDAVCASGAATLHAVTASTNLVHWYPSATGGVITSTNSTFVTPNLTTSQNYYASAFSSLGTVSAGISYSSTGGSSFLGYGLAFDAYTDFMLKTIDIYPIHTSISNIIGTVTIGLIDAVTGSIIATSTQTVLANPTPIANTVDLSFKVMPGSYRLVLLAFNGFTNVQQLFASALQYPFVTPGIMSVTSGYGATPIFTYYYYFYNMQLSLGCEAPRIPIAAVVNPRPNVYAPSIPNIICEGGSANLIGLGASHYTWSPGTSNSPNISVMPNVTTIYTLTGENVSDCSNTTTVEVTVNAKPAVNVASANFIVCSGETATLTASGSLTGYSWSHGGGTNATAMVIPTSNTTYSVTGYDANGCTDTKTVVVQVNAVPPVVIKFATNVICNGESTRLYAISPAITYTWSNGSTTSVVAVSPTVTSTYTVNASNGNCLAKATVIVVVEACTDIHTLNKANGISIYPNPMSDIITVSYGSTLTSGSTFEVFDAVGKLLLTYTLTQENTQIKVSTLENGVYFFRLTDGANILKVGKIIKQ